MLITEERRNLYRDLDSLALPAEAAGRLAALGMTTLEELRDHWTYGNRELISRYLGESPLRLVTAPAAASIATRGVSAERRVRWSTCWTRAERGRWSSTPAACC